MDLLKANKVLSTTDVDSFWWLKKSIVNEDLYLKIQPPLPGIIKRRPPNKRPFGQELIYKVLHPKGRTKARIPDTGRRNYSQFEQRESFEELDAAEQSQSRPVKRGRPTKRAKVQQPPPEELEELDPAFAAEVAGYIQKAEQCQLKEQV